MSLYDLKLQLSDNDDPIIRHLLHRIRKLESSHVRDVKEIGKVLHDLLALVASKK